MYYQLHLHTHLHRVHVRKLTKLLKNFKISIKHVLVELVFILYETLKLYYFKNE